MRRGAESGHDTLPRRSAAVPAAKPACSSWQSIGPVSPSQFIELDQPERVRVYMRGGDQVELERPAVDGDELVAPGNFSMPWADVLVLEVQRFSLCRDLPAGVAPIEGEEPCEEVPQRR